MFCTYQKRVQTAAITRISLKVENLSFRDEEFRVAPKRSFHSYRRFRPSGGARMPLSHFQEQYVIVAISTKEIVTKSTCVMITAGVSYSK
jgi:hypothetical protein